ATTQRPLSSSGSASALRRLMSSSGSASALRRPMGLRLPWLGLAAFKCWDFWNAVRLFVF
ncbi:MAG: hypothetical protein ACKOUR_01650, partial [Planctomycetota bacterium]